MFGEAASGEDLFDGGAVKLFLRSTLACIVRILRSIKLLTSFGSLTSKMSMLGLMRSSKARIRHN